MSEEDQIITLDSGEQIRVTPEGERYLISGPSLLMDQVAAEAEQRRAEQAIMDQLKAEIIDRKRDALDAEPAVPPEKRFF